MTIAIMPVLPFFAATSLAADPSETAVDIHASESAVVQSCAPGNAAATDECDMVSPYSFDLSEWVNQPVIPDHLNVVYEAESRNPDDAVFRSGRGARNEQMLGLDFQDNNDWVQRLKDIDDLSVMTFWQTEATHLFLGVGDDGMPGVHLKQREIKDGRTGEQRKLYRGTNDDGRPLVHSQSLNYNVPDLSKGYPKTESEDSATEE